MPATEQKPKAYLFKIHEMPHSTDDYGRMLESGILRTEPAEIECAKFRRTYGGLAGQILIATKGGKYCQNELKPQEITDLIGELDPAYPDPDLPGDFNDINSLLRGQKVNAYFYGPWIVGFSAVPKSQLPVSALPVSRTYHPGRSSHSY
ncbi:MAG: hypothetical protein AABW88_01980 [Nanoarchaeota archaeon]